MSALRAFAIVVVLALAARARAQDVVAQSSVEALTLEGAGRPAQGDRYIVGSCGRVQSRWDGRPIYEGIYGRAGHAFRGLGSPGRRGEVALGFSATDSRAPDGSYATGYAIPVSLRAALVNMSGRFVSGLCLTVGADLGVVGGWHSIGAGDQATAGHFGGRLGILSRSRDDRMRLHVEAEVVLPSLDHPSVSPWDRARLFQASVANALAMGVDDEILALSPLDWGVRGVATIQYQWSDAEHPESGLWLEVRVSIGYARLATYYGAREGLVGGVRAALLGGSGCTDSEWSLRGGLRGALSVGSLWPSDMLLPTELVGVLQVGNTTHNANQQPDGGSVFELEIGAVWARFPAFEEDFGSEAYFRAGLRYVHAIETL